MTFQPFVTKPKQVSKAKLYMMHVIDIIVIVSV